MRFDPNNLPHMHTVEQLREVLSLVGDEPADDDRLIWFACIVNARATSEYTLKDRAQMFRDGVEPVDNLNAVQSLLDTFYDDISEQEGSVALLLSVAAFFEDMELLEQVADLF